MTDSPIPLSPIPLSPTPLPPTARPPADRSPTRDALRRRREALARARTFLFVPADRPERIDKALASGADAVIVDLEDAVAPERKEQARGWAGEWLGSRAALRDAGDPAAAADVPLVLRVNAPGSEWFTDDRAFALGAFGIDAVMIPKAEHAGAIAALSSSMPVIPLIESAAGLAAARAIAAARNVVRLAFGALDFQLDLGMRAEPAELLPFRCELVLASRLARIAAPIDSPSTAIGDAAVVEAEAAHARRLGFGAKLCIHPRQVAVAARAFAPTADEVAWARRVLAAAQASGGAAVAVDGAMVDRPVILRAQAVVGAAG